MMLTTTSKVNAVKKYAREKDYKNAAGIAEKINLQKVQSKHDLAAIADVYLKLGRFEEAKEVYTELYTRHKSHKVMTGLIELCLKTKDPKQAEVYVREFRKMEPDNPERLIYRYRVDCMLGKSPEYLIRSLSKLKEEEYTDIWALELAKAYYKAGEILACSAECRSILQWFGDSEVAPKAKVLLDACEDVTLLDSQKEAVAASISEVGEERSFTTEVQKEPEVPAEELPEETVADETGECYAQPTEAFVAEESAIELEANEWPMTEVRLESAVSTQEVADLEAETSPEEDLDVLEESLAEEVAEELAYELPENLKGKIDRVFFDDDDDDDDDHDDDDDDDDHDDDDDDDHDDDDDDDHDDDDDDDHDDDDDDDHDDDDDDDHDDDDHDDDDDDDHDDDDDDDHDDDDDDEYDEDEYVIRGYFTDEEIGIFEDKQAESVEQAVEETFGEVVEEATDASEELPVVEEFEAVVAPEETEATTEENAQSLSTFEYWESEPAEASEKTSADAWGKSLSMAFETAYSEAKAQAGKPEVDALAEVSADTLDQQSVTANEVSEEPVDAMEEVIEEAMREIIEEDAEGVSVEAIAEDIQAFAEELTPEETPEQMIPQSVNMTEFFPEESEEEEEPEFILPTFRGFEYEDRLQPEEEQDDLYTNKRFEMKSFISKKDDNVVPVEDDDDDDMPGIAFPDQAKADMYKALLEDDEAEEAAEAAEAAEETATEMPGEVTEASEEIASEAEDLEVTKVHGDLTAQALDAVFREDDKAIERALYNLLADE